MANYGMVGKVRRSSHTKGKQEGLGLGQRAALYTITGAHLSRIRDVTLGLILRAVPKQSTEPNQWGVQEST